MSEEQQGASRGYRCRTCTEHGKCIFKRQESIQPDGTIGGKPRDVSTTWSALLHRNTESVCPRGTPRGGLLYILDERSTQDWSFLACLYGDLIIPQPYIVSETTFYCASFELGQGA